MERLKNLSLRKTLFIYISAALVIGIVLSLFIQFETGKVQQRIWLKYIDIDSFSQISDKIQNEYGLYVLTPRANQYNMTSSDNAIVELCDFLQTWPIFFLSFGAAFGAVLVFYHNKLKLPLTIIEQGAKKIARNDLNFTICYDKEDEMGRLCAVLERMRVQLLLNNKQLWKMVEEQKDLRAVVAHDIRAPLAVLKGYSELLLHYVPQKKIGEEKLVQIIQAIELQVIRLEEFVDFMKLLSSFEKREVHYQNIDVDKFIENLDSTGKILVGQKHITLHMQVSENNTKTILADEKLIMQVYENLINNAVCYARSIINVGIKIKDKTILVLTISDDGMGFSIEKLDMTGSKSFYKNHVNEDTSHFGIGLYICQKLCEKHQGKLVLTNNDTGGASVSAFFQLNS